MRTWQLVCGNHCPYLESAFPSPRSEARGEGQGAGQLIKNATSPRPSPPTSLAERETELQHTLIRGWFLQSNLAVRAPLRLGVFALKFVAPVSR